MLDKTAEVPLASVFLEITRDAGFPFRNTMAFEAGPRIIHRHYCAKSRGTFALGDCGENLPAAPACREMFFPNSVSDEFRLDENLDLRISLGALGDALDQKTTKGRWNEFFEAEAASIDRIL